MTGNADIPILETHLPELTAFVSYLAEEFELGRLGSWQVMTERVQTFFTPKMLDKVDGIVPGWRKMASYADGLTLTHVMTVFTALPHCPEYRAASADQKALLQWIVLFHDVAKEAHPGRRDQTHGFRSAAIAGQALPALGFEVRDGYRERIQDWVRLTKHAFIAGEKADDAIQDNGQLPAIIEGIERLFGTQTAAALLLKTVLLHISITVVHEWPQSAPLTDGEIKRYIDSELMPLLRIMTLVDNDGWSLFDRPTRERHRRETRAVFERIERLIAA